MNSHDPQKAARVWQRVQETQETPREENWQALIQEALDAMAVYRHLAGQIPGKGPQLQQLSREEKDHAACLRGICRAVTGSAAKLQPLPVPRERPDILLRKCYARTVNRVRDYENRCAHPEYGPVFRRLAERQGEHCCRILEILGTLDR